MNNPSTDNPTDGTGSHYFDPSPTSPSHTSEFTIVVAGRTLVLESDAGVFSPHGLDKGTAVLLEWVQQHSPVMDDTHQNLCDLGCGSGPIALVMAVLYPQCTVYALDINERARLLCTENARRNNLTNIIVAHPDEVDTTTSFALLWSNPPIRIGKRELHELLTTWLTRLLPDGLAHLVVSKNLGADSLTTWLNDQGYPTMKKASSKGFRILEVAPQSHSM